MSLFLKDRLEFLAAAGINGLICVTVLPGMQAGDNTLNSHCALEMMKTIQRVDPTSSMPQRHLQAAVLEDYVKFMTTPGTHNDTYAESWHRAFFRDWVQEDEAPTTSSQLIQFAEKRFLQKFYFSVSNFMHEFFNEEVT